MCGLSQPFRRQNSCGLSPPLSYVHFFLHFDSFCDKVEHRKKEYQTYEGGHLCDI